MIPLGIAGGDYVSGYSDIALQEAVNLYPERQEARGRAQVAMLRVPGLASFATIGSTSTDRCRGLHVTGETLFAVYGNTIYTVASDGTETSRGTISGTDRCFFADNGEYTVIVADEKGWYSQNGGAITQITDVDFGIPTNVAFLDGFWLFAQKDSKQIQFNETANDPTSYNGTDVFSKAGDGSDLSRVFVNQRDLFLLGETNTEVWRNAGNVDVPFIRQDGSEMERGCLAPASVAELDNSFHFLGDDRLVYRMDGYTPRRISNHAIEDWLSDLTLAEAQDAFAFAYTYRGHYFYALHAGDLCMVYDATESAKLGQNLWHERASGIRADLRWRVSDVVSAFGKLIAGDLDSNTLWELDHTSFAEGSDAMKWIRTCPPLFEGMRTLRHNRVELFITTGGGTYTTEPEVALERSDDGGRTWSDEKRRGLGNAGEFGRRVIWRNLGMAVNRIYRFSSSSDADVAIADAQADIEVMAR